MRISFDVTGQAELGKRMEALSARVRRQTLLRALEIGGLPIARRQEQLAPFDPESGGPHIKYNIVMEPLRSLDGIRMNEDQAAIGIGPSKHLRHGGFQELGTSEHPPQPYIRPAWDELQASALKRVANELWIAVKAAK